MALSDIEAAKAGLTGHSICLCKGGEIITDDSRGIKPMMKLLAEGRVHVRENGTVEVR